MKSIPAVRGMPATPPPASIIGRVLEEKLIAVLQAFSYKEMRLPMLERTELFRRSVGNATDIVEKEMYEFKDKSDQSVCLRPEGTAGLLRAGLEYGMLSNQKQRLWYLGPMFRYERPQSGRLRQFDQLGAEAIGFESADADTEMILICAAFWQTLGLRGSFLPKLQLNMLGNAAERSAYEKALVSYFSSRAQHLSEDDNRRLKSAPLRLLDSKHPSAQDLLKDAPSLVDYIGEENKADLRQVCANLDALEISYEINPRLVRGLDYYTNIVFEWVSEHLGAQNTLCAGGRYDALIELLGGISTPATGFAMGMERLKLLLQRANGLPTNERANAHLLLICLMDSTQMFVLRHKIWKKLPNLKIECALDSLSLKVALKRANKQNIPFVCIWGEEEAEKNLFLLRDMQAGEQQHISWDDFFTRMQKVTNNG